MKQTHVQGPNQILTLKLKHNHRRHHNKNSRTKKKLERSLIIKILGLNDWKVRRLEDDRQKSTDEGTRYPIRWREEREF